MFALLSTDNAREGTIFCIEVSIQCVFPSPKLFPGCPVREVAGAQEMEAMIRYHWVLWCAMYVKGISVPEVKKSNCKKNGLHFFEENISQENSLFDTL